ncbi:hypothetical protein J3R83DRAFT_1607 [Lanmaoa asiatica]|nr:hypothetical protein J3R83DRAFT_1607 [Lanmaoa asiatica]
MFRYPPIDWRYPSSGPAPPSPVVVNSVLEYFGGRPTPPPSPLRTYVTIDDFAPCPPTPCCVPSGVEDDEWSNGLNSGTSQSTSSGPNNYWFTSELDPSTSFADPLMDESSNDSGHQAQYDNPLAGLQPLSVADRILYARKTYAYPSPVLTMMERACLDMNGLETQPVNPRACSEPLKLFTLTGGHTPLTGLDDHDQQSFKYYAKRPYPSPLRVPECLLSYRYPTSSIEGVQHSLRTEYSLVYPAPIPPVIIRSRDLIEPYGLTRRNDGFAYVVPTEDSIWDTIRRRGVDLDFRPLDRSLAVETHWCNKGDAFYYPQHIVASKFAVNVFLELADSATRPNPLCEYLGAYVLQVIDGITIDRSVWTDIDPEVQQAVFDRAPDCFRVYRHPSSGRPHLPYIRFCYYKWDRNIVGLADESPDRNILTASQGTSRREAEDESVDSAGYSHYTDPGFYTDQYCDCEIDEDTESEDTESTSSAYSSEQPYVSVTDFSSCA